MKSEINYDDYYLDLEKVNRKKGFYLRELGKDYVLYFKTKSKRNDYIDQEKSRYDFRFSTIDV